MNWFKKEQPKIITDDELQIELKVFCQLIALKGFADGDDRQKYGNLLRAIYKRGLKPSAILKMPN